MQQLMVNGGKINFLTNGARNMGYPKVKKMNLNLSLELKKKIDSRKKMDFNVKHKTEFY